MGKSETALADITHWIGGCRVVAGHRHERARCSIRPPARSPGRCGWPMLPTVDAAVQRGAACAACVERDLAAQSGTRDVSLQGTARAQS